MGLDWRFVRSGSMLGGLAAGALGCGSGGGFPDAPPIDSPPPGGTFKLDWAVHDSNGTAISCDDVGASWVNALVRNRAAVGGSTEVFTCSNLTSTSPPIPP